MTNWNLSFDYAAVFLLVLIIIWYLNEKKIPLKSHSAFLTLVTVTLLATVLEIVATLMARNMDTVGFESFYNVLTLQMLMINMVPIAFGYYILMLAHIDITERTVYKIFFYAVIVVDVLIGFLNPVMHWAFTFENDKIVSNYASVVVYGIDAVMLIICIVTLIRNAKEFLFIRSIVLFFNLVCGVIACVLQMAFNVPMINFMIAALCLTLYYYMQNPGAVTDPVTKLFNRKFMGEYLQNKFMSGKRFGIISLAMDDFKFINKTYGVDNGDNLLFQVGAFLDSIRIHKTLFRFGSDQFCMVLTRNPGDTKGVAEEIQERFRHPWYSESSAGIMMSASICCIECPTDAENYGELIEVMDYSMSVAKKLKKGGIMTAADMELDNIRDDKAIEKAVKLAIDRDELMVYYQPIFSVSKGVYNSAEALVRLHDDELGWISPEKFIPIAEKNGLIIDMGEMILDKVCRFIHDFKLSETTVEYIEVNISPVQLLQVDFAERVKSIMENYGVTPDQINIEITETATMGSVAVIEKNINRLVEYGIKFSLDDYGSGNSNIDYINRMPFSIIKLDKYIIWDAFKNTKAGITLEYTIGMLNALNLLIVAEGVETEEMKNRLVEIGCHYMQGWYYSKAIADVDFIKLING